MSADARLREALTDIGFAGRYLVGDSDVTREDAALALHEATRTLRLALRVTEPAGALDVPATFPLELAAFIAGLDSPNHSPESRAAWCRLFFRDMQRAARLSATPDTETGETL